MTSYYEPARELLVKGNYDVIVCGSGPSGMAAAVAAGRLGMRVLLIEALGNVGGISTSGMMSHWTGRCGSRMYEEFKCRQAEKDPFGRNKAVAQIDPELMKTVYIEMLDEVGAELLLYSFVCGAVMDGNKIRGVIVENKSGRSVYTAQAVIDCTGDGDVAALAGAEYYKGRESDGLMQPATMMLKVGGVDYDKAVFPGSFETKVATEKGELQALALEKLPHPAGHVLLYRSTLPGIVTLNMTNVTGIDGTKTEDLTRAEKVCRSQMAPIIRFLREYAPGYEKCYIISAASMIGIRETRHFKGMYTLTEEDILAAKQFDDAVVLDAWFNFDVHNLTGASLDATGVQKEFKQPLGYTIPYGCMVPEKIDGLLLSGRNISGTHMAHSNFRVMPICAGIGEADGIAAALSIKKGIKLRDVKPEDIRCFL